MCSFEISPFLRLKISTFVEIFLNAQPGVIIPPSFVTCTYNMLMSATNLQIRTGPGTENPVTRYKSIIWKKKKLRKLCAWVAGQGPESSCLDFPLALSSGSCTHPPVVYVLPPWREQGQGSQQLPDTVFCDVVMARPENYKLDESTGWGGPLKMNELLMPSWVILGEKKNPNFLRSQFPLCTMRLWVPVSKILINIKLIR